ncbi:hypothetical protein ABR738_15620 [Streptomyces sp. Edi4]|uniref:hypothetical protein n=1 Tax=Streptomyces sp. Edi4 TaxID=3162527 RepID=UPI003305A05D
MASKTQSTKAKKGNTKPLETFNSTPLYLRVIAVAVLVALITWLAFFRADQRYSANTDEVKSRIQTALEATQLPGKQLASTTVDQGCDSGSSVGLSTRIECSMEGYKYFEITGDKKATLSLANTKLESLGFKKFTDNDYTHQVLDGTRGGDVDYSKQHTTARIGWSTWPTSVNGPESSAITDALISHRIGAPADGATVVGVTVKETYWTCSSSGLDILGISCIFPPHSANK